jgi:hypothetical protein
MPGIRGLMLLPLASRCFQWRSNTFYGFQWLFVASCGFVKKGCEGVISEKFHHYGLQTRNKI